LRLGVAILVFATLTSCSAASGTFVVVSPSPAQTLAADLRTHLDLLLGEHVMIVAKETAAAVNHADDYDEYASLLAANASDLGGVFASAFGNTTSSELLKSWTAQDEYLVDYGISVVTHDDAKAKAAMLTLTNEFVPDFARELSDASGLGSDSLAAMLSSQAAADRTCIDDYFAQKYPTFYADLHAAYALTESLGDTVAKQVAQKYPDKFPGDPSRSEVERRVDLNDLLQEHAYVSTMATDAVVGARTAEVAAATAALGTNGSALAALFGSGLPALWTSRTNGLLAYARGDAVATSPLTVDFVKGFAELAHVDRSPVSRQMMETLNVIDDQRRNDSKDVAADDRTAATAMEPIADAAS
jgi:hypothetical protein